LHIFYRSIFIEHFIESLLRVSDIAGTAVLMLALGYALGSIAEFAIGYWFFVRDFKLPRMQLLQLIFQSFSASVIGGAVTYAILALTGTAGEVNTALGLLLQGTIAGVAGLIITACTLALLKNKELYEALATINHRFKRSSVTALEATDVSS
jgi:hypothetical protein